MQSKVITYLNKDIALERIKSAKSYMDTSKLQLIYKTKRGKYVIGGVYEFNGELKFKGSQTLINSVDKVIILD